MATEVPFGVALVAGGAAGTGVDTILFPIDTIKTRLQAKGGFLANGGFRGVYKGLSSAVLGSAPGAALFFTTYETAKTALTPVLGGGPLTHMAAASLGEVAACLVRVPTEVMKQRLQAGQYSTLAEAASAAWKADGVAAFFRGYMTTVIREIPFAFIQFPLYEGFKKGWKASRGPDGSLGSHEAALCGSVAGGIAAAITTPLDVAKTRIMLSDSTGAVASTSAMLKKIVAEEGAGALFAGIQPRVMWISIGGFVFFGIYESVKRLLTSSADGDDDDALA